MKRVYVEPIAEIFLCNEDVITTSVTVDGDDNVVVWPGSGLTGPMEEGVLR